MHFADMQDQVRAEVGRHLSGEPIGAVINSHWHSNEEDPHGTVFGRYTKMVQLLLAIPQHGRSKLTTIYLYPNEGKTPLL
jgi:hypothetical protein